MNTTLLLGDYARVSDGKLDVLGAGWSLTGPGRVTIGIGLLFEVEWHETNMHHVFDLTLIDADGAPVENEAGETLFHTDGGFEVGRPPGLKAGTPQSACVALNLAGIPVPPGGRYAFRLVVDGDEETGVNAGFSTRPSGPQSLAA